MRNYSLLETITGDKRFLEVKDMLTQEERTGGITMCEGLDRREKRAIMEGEKRGEKRGKKEGEKKGENRMLQLIQCMLENGESELIAELGKKPVLLQKMYQKYQLQ